MIARLSLVAALALLAACAAPRPAPVVDRTPAPARPGEAAVQPPAPADPVPPKPLPTHTVKRGETLVGIALQYGLDYRELAAWNLIVNPNVLAVGQVLVLAPPAGTRPAAAATSAAVTTPLAGSGPPIEARPMSNTATAKVEPRAQKLPYSDRALAQLASPEAGSPPSGTPPVTAAMPEPAPTAAEPEKPAGTDREDIDWMWPVKGKVIAPFSEATKGMDIGGRKGAPVLAAASGRVVYAGDGLRGYGNLVIIKHSNTWLSAYAHNDKLLVKEQDEVRKGQKIAEMGATGTDAVKLHFEVRRQGKPVDPQKVLPAM